MTNAVNETGSVGNSCAVAVPKAPGDHPVWDGSEVRKDDDTNRRAERAMIAFYLGRGFMEAPLWEDTGEDERYGWRSVIAAFDRAEIPPPASKGA